MVGGSVSGKTFKPDPSSYEATGIPCGNPRRYKNRSVMRMIPNKNVPYENQQLGAPGKGTISEAEDHLQDMLKTQLDTKVSLNRASKKRKLFTEPVVYDSSQEKASGFMTLSNYNKFDVLKEKEAELTGMGLTKDEVKLKMVDCGLLNEDCVQSNYGVNPEVEKDRRVAIQEKIQRKKESLSQQTTFSNVRTMSRHAMEVEQSLNKGTEKSMAFSHLLHSSQKFDPALDAVLKEFEKRSVSQKVDGESDMGVDGEDESDGCTDEDERIIPLDEEVIKRHRLTLNEIRALPRFKEYEPGIPSRVLYIKNLSKKVTDADLKALFNRFIDESCAVNIRLMSGRMRGQAFVTFEDKSIAIAAFELINGYQLYERTVVIQYGKNDKFGDK
ncbi:RNA-binding protein 41-like [Xenia sp. Carnegie-2017]|uniref:RNA-binding protein 41-like n=1 Tax=Xenia sp. Carnegie-2017 TaxID=2897299 RepID=UPI001F0392FE|nr:RNA-binding protein 41-like [Xenia sp. Carnegie-2017]